GAVYAPVLICNMGVHLGCALLAIITCRSRPNLFNTLSKVVMVLYSPVMKIVFGQSTIFSLLYTSQVFPSLALFSDEWSSTFILLSVIQVTYLYWFGYDDFLLAFDQLKKETIGFRIIYV